MAMATAPRSLTPKRLDVIETIDLIGSPEFAVADGKMIYANLANKNQVAVIDAALWKSSHWPTAPSGGSTALAMDRAYRRLFSAGHNPQVLVVMDADNGKIIQSFPITAGTDAAAYDPETQLIFVSTREGKIHIFHEDSPDKFSVVDTVTTEVGARPTGLDAKTHNHSFLPALFGVKPRDALFIADCDGRVGMYSRGVLARNTH